MGISSKVWRAALACTAMSAMGSGAQSAWAEESTSSSVREVVVTGAHRKDEAISATKTATPLVETPQSISVIDRGQLDTLVVTNLNQALHYTAGVSPDTRGNTAGRYDLMNIRGFSPDQYLDGLRLINSVNGYATPQVDLSRLDRIDVIKGPSSVLYGEASPGGIVAMTSKLPTDKAFGEVDLSGGSFNTVEGAFDLGGPLDKDSRFLFRLDGMVSHGDTPIRLTETERVAISPSLTWLPDDKTSWTLLYSFQYDPKAGGYGSVPPQGSLLPNPLGRVPVDFYDGEPDYERFKRYQNALSSFFVRDLGGGWSFHQNFRYLQVDTDYASVYSFGLDPDFMTLNRYVADAVEVTSNFTLDNQIAGKFHTGPISHSVIVGLDYQYTGQTEVAGFGGSVVPINIFHPVYGAPVTPPATSFNARLRLNQTGVYAQDQMAWGGLRLMLSGRYDWVDTNQLDRLSGSTTRSNPTQFTGRVGLLYLFDNGLAPYASYSTSFVPQTASSPTGVLPPTTGKQAEIGLKWEPRVWDTLLTVSLYDLRETNVATSDLSNPIYSVATGEVVSRGIEFEGRTRPIKALQLSASFTYLDNTVTKDNTGLVGTHPYGVPRQTANAFGVYTWQDGPLAGASLGGGVRFLGRNYNGVAGTTTATALGSFAIPSATLYDLIAGYDLVKLSSSLHGASLNVSVTNLANARYISSCYATFWCWYGEPRSVQASLHYRW